MKALIIEDSRLARVELRTLLKVYPEVELVGEAANSEEALSLVTLHNPDLFFLDIDLPGKNGFEFLESLDEVPYVVFTTAYDQFAIKAFEYNTLDYLLKPIDSNRLGAAIAKVQQQMSIQTTKAVEVTDTLGLNSRIFVKDQEQCWLVEIQQIRRFESVGNYTRIYFEEEQSLIYKSLNQIEKRLPSQQFFRANRQEIIQLQYIQEMIPWFNGKLKIRMTDKAEVEVSRRQTSRFKKLLSL